MSETRKSRRRPPFAEALDTIAKLRAHLDAAEHELRSHKRHPTDPDDVARTSATIDLLVRMRRLTEPARYPEGDERGAGAIDLSRAVRVHLEHLEVCIERGERDAAKATRAIEAVAAAMGLRGDAVIDVILAIESMATAATCDLLGVGPSRWTERELPSDEMIVRASAAKYAPGVHSIVGTQHPELAEALTREEDRMIDALWAWIHVLANGRRGGADARMWKETAWLLRRLGYDKKPETLRMTWYRFRERAAKARPNP